MTARLHPPEQPYPRPRGIRTSLAVLGLLAALGCGGGSSSPVPDPEPVDPPPPGVTGKILLADVELGRIAEHEPNDSRSQSYRLAPIGPRTLLEITGEVGTSSAQYGHVDPVDVFRVEPLAGQDVAASLRFTATDPVGLGPNDVEVEVWDANTDTLLAATVGGTQPRVTAFAAAGGGAYDVLVRCQAGHAAYTLSLISTDPAGGAVVAAKPPVPEERVARIPSAGPAPVAACAGTHVLVRLLDGTDAEAFAARFGLIVGRRTGLGSTRLHFPERVPATGRASYLAALCDRLAADPAVVWAEPDWVVQPTAEPSEPDDADYARQWNLRVVGAVGAWAVTEGDPSVIVGIVDTGIVDHPDLDGQRVAGYDFISDRSISGDGNGRDPDPTDVGAQDKSSGLSSWHGTHVAAIVAAKSRDGYGFAGVAPGCRVMPLRAVGIGGGLVSDVADAILYAAGLLTTEDGRFLAEPLPIVNLSFALPQDTTELRSACSRAANVGVLLVGATGNSGEGVLYPAKYDSVVAVAAVDRRLDTTGYSNFGDEIVLSAPGGLKIEDVAAAGWPDSIPSCVLDDTLHPPEPGIGFLEGTSQAAPHVAGAAALLLSVDPTLSGAELEQWLIWGALDRGLPGKDEAYGWGVLQVHESVRLLLDDLGTPLVTPPCLWMQMGSVLFTGFQERCEVVVMNVGGGRLEFSEPTATVDGGGTWLSAENIPALGSGPTAVAKVAVLVDRHALSAAPGRHSGSVFLRDDTGAHIGSIRVVVYVKESLLAGRDLTVLVRRAANGAVDTRGTASPTQGYRYWFPALSPNEYKIMSGSDLDGDGFFCESADACGWYGGATEPEATVVTVSRDTTRFGTDIQLYPP